MGGLLLFYPHYCDMTYQPPQTMLLSVNPHPSHISTSLTVSPPLGSCGPPRHHEDLVASHAQTNGLVSALQASRPQAAKGRKARARVRQRQLVTVNISGVQKHSLGNTQVEYISISWLNMVSTQYNKTKYSSIIKYK